MRALRYFHLESFLGVTKQPNKVSEPNAAVCHDRTEPRLGSRRKGTYINRQSRSEPMTMAEDSRGATEDAEKWDGNGLLRALRGSA